MKYIKLELRKNSCKPYLMASLGILITTILLTILFASMHYLDPTEVLRDSRVETSSFVLTLSITILTVAYICLAAVMNSKFILEAYNKNNVFLTLSYPVSREKILSSKIILVNLFSLANFLGTTILIVVLFTIFNNIFNIMVDKVTISLLISIIPTILLSIVFIISVSVFSLLIGWIKQSTPSIIITAVIVSSLISNLISLEALALLIVSAVLISLLGIMSVIILNSKIKNLEVE